MQIQTSVPGLVRDTESGVVKNLDVSAYENYKLQRSGAMKSSEIEQRVGDLERGLDEVRGIIDKIYKCKGICSVASAS